MDELLAELEAFGEENDKIQTERPKRMLNITRDTGQFLAVLVKATASRRLLEIGTSNGYSTLWLAWAAQGVGGHVTTVERSEFKVSLARSNFERSGLSHVISRKFRMRRAMWWQAPLKPASISSSSTPSARSIPVGGRI